ncbi:hypothetical protein ACFFGH_09465 [Lysobacter korlensis]|uniref:Uncharacterized protein n=1 Tax=Lysobacter korlensis TaxID=553636 RepID=A0ABV6RM61_9GAMM
MNRTVQTRWAATAAAIACIAPAALIATPAAAAETGTLTVTVFEDRYADARFDPSLTTTAGQSDTLRSSGSVFVQDSAGNWFGTDAESTGEYVFDGIALGEAKVYTADPNSYESVAFFLTDGEQATTMPHTAFSFAGGTYLYAGGDGRLTNWSASRDHVGEGTVTVGAESTARIGMTAVTASVKVLAPGTGTPDASLADVGFVANGEQIESKLVWDGVTYYPTRASLVPNGLGITVTPADGFVVDSVVAHNSVSWPAQELTVLERDGTYYVDTTELPLYFDRAEFSVQLREAVVLTGKDECKEGGWATSDAPVFANQGQCVSFFASATRGNS